MVHGQRYTDTMSTCLYKTLIEANASDATAAAPLSIRFSTVVFPRPRRWMPYVNLSIGRSGSSLGRPQDAHRGCARIGAHQQQKYNMWRTHQGDLKVDPV